MLYFISPPSLEWKQTKIEPDTKKQIKTHSVFIANFLSVLATAISTELIALIGVLKATEAILNESMNLR